MKTTATAPSNLAFIKYWGVKNEKLRLPTNGSISMNLSNLLTTTTVEFSDIYLKDEVAIDGKKAEKKSNRVIEHLERIRKRARIVLKAKVVSQNNFPIGTGLSSSASGFAALTVAASTAAGLKLSEKELTILARQASGASCRSIPDGFVEWFEGDSEKSSYATSIFPSNWWDIIDIVCVVSSKTKDVSSTEGHKLAQTSPFFKTRLSSKESKLKDIRHAIEKKDFNMFGILVEQEALELHSIMLTSNPSLIYLLPETLKIMKEVQTWRNEGLSVYFSLNTGQNIHILCQNKDVKKTEKKLNTIKKIKRLVINHPSKGTRLSNKHLF